MTIAVQISLPDIQTDTDTNFAFKCFTILAEKYPENRFVFIFDKPFDAAMISASNITGVHPGPQIRNRLLQHYVYNFKLPRLLNKYQADIFVSEEVCSLRTNIQQYLLIHDLSFLQKNSLRSKPEVRYLKRYTRLFIKKATKILLFNPFLKLTLEEKFESSGNKISLVNAAIEAGAPVDYETADAFRSELTGGKQYFVFISTDAAAANILIMLKSFSIFKKWQKSNMQLLILFSSKTQEIAGLSTYKHRDDIKIMGNESPEYCMQVVASAYAAIYLPAIDVEETEGLKSLSAGVPLITTETGFNRGLYNDSALYVSLSEKDISDMMMMLYKDEQTRNGMIDKGIKLAANHSWANTIEQMWEIIQAFPN